MGHGQCVEPYRLPKFRRPRQLLLGALSLRLLTTDTTQ